MHIEIWSIGKENEPFIDEGIKVYSQRLKTMANVRLQLLRLPRRTAGSDPRTLLLAEEELIMTRLRPQDYLILLDENGKLLNSVQWSEQIQQRMNQGSRRMILLIGGAYGVSQKVKQQAHQIWSLSPLVFPHQLVRLMVYEQVYRSFTLLNGLPYHHH